MIRSKRGLAVLSLCAVALGAVIFGPGAVQAEEGANWMVNGSNVTVGLLPIVQISEVSKADIKLSTKISGASIAFLCTGAEFIGAKLETNGKVASGNKTKFTGCTTIINGIVSSQCVPRSAGQPNGTVVSTELKGLLILHESQAIILFEPVTGNNFLVLQFGEECSLPENCPIIGKNSVKDAKGEFKVELTQHLVEQGPISELWVVSKTPEHAATVQGSAALKLTGAHEGSKWSALPG